MDETYPHLHIILLCDKSGAQLWPFADSDAPACLAPVSAESETSLLAATAQRVAPYSACPLHIVCGEQYAHALEDALLSDAVLSELDTRMFVTPPECGLALAVALVAARIRREDPDAVLALVPTHHIVELDDRWQRLLACAYRAAQADKIALVGTQQDEPCAGNVLVHRGARLDAAEGAFSVKQLSVDAPAFLARRARREGALWYTGLLFARAAVLLGEFSRVAQTGRSDVVRGSTRIVETAHFFAELKVSDLLKHEAREFIASVPAASLEKALLEASDQLAVVPTGVEFFAVETLLDLCRTAQTDERGNHIVGSGSAPDSREVSLLSVGGKRTLIAIGMRDCVVVDTDDTVLVVDKGHLDKMPQAYRAALEDDVVHGDAG